MIDWAALSPRERDAVDAAIADIHTDLLAKLHESISTPMFMGVHAAVQLVSAERDRCIDDLAARGGLFERALEAQRQT